MPNSVEIHSQNKRSNVGVKTSQPTSHGFVPMKVMNVCAKTVGSSMVPRMVLTKNHWTSSQLLRFQWLLQEPEVNNLLLVPLPPSMELIQQLIKIRHVSVIRTRNSSIRASSRPQNNSGDHPNSSNNQKVNSRRPLSM